MNKNQESLYSEKGIEGQFKIILGKETIKCKSLLYH